MWKTALLLIVTLVVIPFIAFRFDDPLTASQQVLLTRLLLVYLAAALLCFITSSITGNYSQVDKLWSLMPVVYAWMIAHHAGYEGRLVMMALLVTIWGIRLTYNFARRGGYSFRIWDGREDYRWPILRENPGFKPAWKWVIFNFLFISLYQMGLILLITLPALRSIGGGGLTLIDFILAATVLFFIDLEFHADQQQWNYQKRKKAQAGQEGEVPADLLKGFVDTGLWQLVRHPNYAAEQAVWITFYFFSVTATGRWLNWSVVGALLLVLLFYGSSSFSESITAGKYPGYEEYRRRVPRFIPFFKKRS